MSTPRVLRTIDELRAVCDATRRAGGSVGLVPTMGYFHAGHRSLMRAARAADDLVVVSFFVNPTQFGPNEDLAAYPRDLEGDTKVAGDEGVDVLFAPSVDEMYPSRESRPCTSASSRQDCAARAVRGTSTASRRWSRSCSRSSARAAPYFGRKDAQQLAVVTRMAADLNLPVEVVGCPLVREPDGVAMSSRNAYLTPEERAAAPVLARALRAAADEIVAGERDAPAVVQRLRERISEEPLVELDYAELVDAATLRPIERIEGDASARARGVRRQGPPDRQLCDHRRRRRRRVDLGVVAEDS